MVTKKPKGLGRGLEALLGADAPGIGQLAQGEVSQGQPSTLPVNKLQAGKYQPRTRMDEGALAELADSIRAQGIMQPILVRPVDAAKGRYEIIAGERRFRAAQLAGLTEVPVLVKDVADEHAAAMALIENIQREDLNPLEEAQGVKRLLDEFGLTHEQASQATCCAYLISQAQSKPCCLPVTLTWAMHARCWPSTRPHKSNWRIRSSLSVYPCATQSSSLPAPIKEHQPKHHALKPCRVMSQDSRKRFRINLEQK